MDHILALYLDRPMVSLVGGIDVTPSPICGIVPDTFSDDRTAMRDRALMDAIEGALNHCGGQIRAMARAKRPDEADLTRKALALILAEQLEARGVRAEEKPPRPNHELPTG